MPEHGHRPLQASLSGDVVSLTGGGPKAAAAIDATNVTNVTNVTMASATGTPFPVAGESELKVEVCHGAAARPGQPAVQFLKTLILPAGTTIHEAIHHSGVLSVDPRIDLSCQKVGIHGKLKELGTVLRDGDRVEIYRPLQVDPMAARRRRASVKR